MADAKPCLYLRRGKFIDKSNLTKTQSFYNIDEIEIKFEIITFLEFPDSLLRKSQWCEEELSCQASIDAACSDLQGPEEGTCHIWIKMLDPYVIGYLSNVVVWYGIRGRLYMKSRS